MDVPHAREALQSGRDGSYWVDTLHLDAVPELLRANAADAPLRLVVHYLPSLVTAGLSVRREGLTNAERTALDGVHGFLTTSRFMSGLLGGLGAGVERIGVVEPGVAVARNAEGRRSRPGAALRALLVANLTPPKGVREFLESLGRTLSREVGFRLIIVGSLEADRDYAVACRRIVETQPSLRGRVAFAGALTPDEVGHEMSRTDVLVSASTLETYGMALAEARAWGLPIIARRGGNVENIVDEGAGGALFGDSDALASGVVSLAVDPSELERRSALAVSRRRSRTWAEAAADFVRLFGGKADE